MTVLIQGGRRSGRTSRLVARVRENPNAILVVHGEQERRRIIREYGLPSSQVIVPRGGRGRNADFYVDNADLVLAAVLGQVPKACVFEGDELSGCAKRGCCNVLKPWNSFETRDGKVYCLFGHVPRLARLRLWWQERRDH